MPVSDFLELMPHTVTYAAVTSRNGYGKPSFGSTTSYRARVSYRTVRVANMFTGQDAVAAGEVWIAGALVPGDVDDRITLPDGSTPPIVAWDVVPDESGAHHTKLKFGSTNSTSTG